MKAKMQYCKVEDKVFYLPIESDNCPYCKDGNCLENVFDEEGAIIGYNVEVPDQFVVTGTFEECYECGELVYCDLKEYGRTPYYEDATWRRLIVYTDPWGDGEEIVLHMNNHLDEHGNCMEKLTDTSWADFRFFYCEGCERYVARQCLSNGWHSYTRIINDCEEVCLKCFEELLLSGQVDPINDDGAIVGMFFNQGELEEKGFKCIGDYFIQSEESRKQYAGTVNAYVYKDFIVVNEYTSMGIGGGEGFVSLWIKSKFPDRLDCETDTPDIREKILAYINIVLFESTILGTFNNLDDFKLTFEYGNWYLENTRTGKEYRVVDVADDKFDFIEL